MTKVIQLIVNLVCGSAGDKKDRFSGFQFSSGFVRVVSKILLTAVEQQKLKPETASVRYNNKDSHLFGKSDQFLAK
jgi:hypothetical protein